MFTPLQKIIGLSNARNSVAYLIDIMAGRDLNDFETKVLALNYDRIQRFSI